MTITIIGLGLIGGSVAYDLKRRAFADHIIGVDQSVQHEQQALALGFVDDIKDLQSAVYAADLVVLAIPVNESIRILPKIMDYCSEHTTVVDMGSTKRAVVEVLKAHPKRAQFVAAHPMAGTEHSGPYAAVEGLFESKVAILCEVERSSEASLKLVTKALRCLGMRVIHMDADKHDQHAAYVSHISHISSFVLANTVLEKEQNDGAIFDLASGGFSSTVRLAKSSPTMWAQIFDQNAEHVLAVMDTYIQKMQEWRELIDKGDYAALSARMEEANAIRKILDRPEANAPTDKGVKVGR